MKDSESILLTNIFFGFVHSKMLSIKGKNNFKKLVSGSSSRVVVKCSWTANDSKDITSKFGAGVI